MNKFNKSIANEFRTGFGRFMAIMAIIALGVGFMIGIMQTTPDMKDSMDRYFASSAAYDIDVKAAYGLSAEDVEAIEAMTYDGGPMCETVMPYISTDNTAQVTQGTGSVSLALRLNGVDFDKLTGKTDGGVNLLTLEEGEWPSSADECVIQRSSNNLKDVAVGSRVALTGDGQYGDGDIYARKEFTVVGIVSSPEYYYFDAAEVTMVGTGVIGMIAYVSEEAYGLGAYPLFNMLGTEYTDAAVILRGSDEYTVFTDSYDEFVKSRTNDFALLGAERGAAQVEKIESVLAALPGLGVSGIDTEAMAASASWYALDIVSCNYSYVGFSMNADKVAQLAGVFPVFFILVAALVALTSMTRMVSEDRLEIGTFKALGYSSSRVIGKYMLYCCTATVLGCVIGGLLGFSLLPIVIWEAYKVLYYLPAFVLGFSPLISIVTLVVALAVTVLVTLYACRSMLTEKPAQLMTQKAPKPGKKIALERITPLWKRLRFRDKATIRNIFRYKRNMILTIISVMGCTALVFAGFGMSNSLSGGVDAHFSEIQKYDMSLRYSYVSEELEDFVSSDGTESFGLYSEDGTIYIENSKRSGTQTVTVYAVDAEKDGIGDFLGLRDSRGNALDLSGTGESGYAKAALGKNYADEYKVSVGDTITYRRSDGTEYLFEISCVAENYVNGVLYLDYDTFASYALETHGEEIGENTYLLNLSYAYDKEALAEELYSYGDSVTSVSFSSDTRAIFSGLDEVMGYITAVLVVCAAALVAIVLYNLTNINIDERKREIATLRVLGYTRGEVAGYIYRESAVITIIGALLGIALGALLVWFVCIQISNAAMLITYCVSWWTYVVSFFMTLAFAAIVYAFMTIKLNRIDMADSMKSNE